MKDTMLLDVLRRNGVHDKYTTNDNECMNSKFKKHVNHKAPDLPKFTRDVEEFARSDHTVIQKRVPTIKTQGNTDTITARNINVSVPQPTVRRPGQLPVQGQGRGGIVDQGVPSVIQGRIPTPMPIYPTPQPGQFWLYLLQFCPRQVSICFGCSHSLRVNGIICEPPHDLVIVSNMMRGYMHNGEHMTRRGNVYFHFNLDCVKRKQPLFEFSYLFLPADVVRYFLPVHLQFLALHGLRP